MMVAAVIGVPATAHAADADHGGGDGVRCNEQALKKAIKKANDHGGGTLSLARRCTYTITTPDNAGNALPVITSKITIYGNGSTIQRSSTTAFRIFQSAPRCRFRTPCVET
jgi:polygalacturonase